MEVAELVKRVLGASAVKQYDKHHGHFIATASSYKYYVIHTTATLRNSKSVFKRDYGEMLGVRSSILTQDFDYIVWVIERNNCISIYMERSYRVNSFCLENQTVYRNKATGEYVCNYPVSLAKKSV